MGDALGELHFLLWREATSLHVLWGEYKCLFSDSEASVDLLNSTAPAFFGRVQHLLWSETLLALCRLTDPSAIRGRRNLSLAQLATEITDPHLRSSFALLERTARDRTEFARDWRNRHLAHRDLLWSKDPSAHPLERATREQVELALGAIRDALNLIQSHFEGNATCYGHSIEPLGGSATLLHRLRGARRGGDQ